MFELGSGGTFLSLIPALKRQRQANFSNISLVYRDPKPYLGRKKIFFNEAVIRPSIANNKINLFYL